MNEISTISREDAKKQFEYWTEKLGLVHTFTFDEMYDALLIIRAKKQNLEDFRIKITDFEQRIKELPETLLGDCFPLTHNFADGLYIRQIIVPGNVLTVTKIHAKTHPFFLLKGEISILTEDGVKRLKAPYSGITIAGTKRIIWHHDEVVLTTVHRTDSKNLEQIEAEVIAKDFEQFENQAELKHIADFVNTIKQLEMEAVQA